MYAQIVCYECGCVFFSLHTQKKKKVLHAKTNENAYRILRSIIFPSLCSKTLSFLYVQLAKQSMMCKTFWVFRSKFGPQNKKYTIKS